MNSPTELEIVQGIIDAKNAEDDAKQKRIELEEALIAIVGKKDEGSQTHKIGDYKVTITAKLTRTLDKNVWAKVENAVPESLRPVEYKPSLDLKGLRYLELNEPEVFKLVSTAVTVKPAKPSVSIKL